MYEDPHDVAFINQVGLKVVVQDQSVCHFPTLAILDQDLAWFELCAPPSNWAFAVSLGPIALWFH